MKKEILNVYELCGEFCIDENDINALAEKIIKYIGQNVAIELDFSEVNTVLTAFFNGLMAKLFEKFEYQTIKNMISFSDDTLESVVIRYNKSLENARIFYSETKEVQNSITKKVNSIFNEVDLND